MSTELLLFSAGHAFSAVVLICLWIFILFKNWKSKQNILFLFLTFSAAFQNVYISVGSVLPVSDFSYSWWLLSVGKVFITVSYTHFILEMIGRAKALRWYISGSYVAAAFFIGAAFITPGLFMSGVHEISFMKSFPIPEIVYNLHLAFFLLGPIYPFIELVRSYRRGGMNRRRDSYFILASLIAFGLGPTGFLFIYGIPFSPLPSIFFGWYAFLIAYGIFSENLLDIKVAIKQAFFYTLLVAIATAAIIAIPLLNDYIVSRYPVVQLWVIPLLSVLGAAMVGRAFWAQSQESEHLKYEFITVVAHKLRTPLTHIKWEVTSLLDGTPQPEVRSALERIDHSNARLIELSNILSETAQAADVRYGYSRDRVSLQPLVETSIQRFDPVVQRRKLTITTSIDSSLSPVVGDAQRLSSVVDVLVENACMYSEDGGMIRISLRAENHAAVFEITDEGIGIAAEDRKRIFTKFFRTERARAKDTEGVGLGLAMAKTIIERHRGVLGFRSVGEGKGATFWFSIPQ